MEAKQRKIVTAVNRHWHAELIGTDMFWCDILVDAKFSADSDQLSQYVVDYRDNLKHHIEDVLSEARLYLMCEREKVRFNAFKKPGYNPFTRKMKFHFLVGESSRRVSLTVDIRKHFFPDLAHPKVFLEAKFITLLKNEKDNVTLSVHDFLSAIGADLGLNSRVVSSGYSRSPYWGGEEGALVMLQRQAARFTSDDKDLVVYINEYNMHLFSNKSRASNQSGRNIIEFSDESIDMSFMMLSRSFSLYFLGCDAEASVEVKNAMTNVSRYLSRNQIHRITVDHAYEQDGEYLRLCSQEVETSPSHVFTVLLEHGKVVLDRGEIYD